jgi:MFS family permease
MTPPVRIPQLAAEGGDHAPASCWTTIGRSAARPSRFKEAAGRGFWPVAYLYLVVSIGATLQAPLYILYQDRWHFSPLVLTSVFAAYPVGVLISLFFFGGLADQAGRRPVLIGVAALAALSAVVYLFAHGVSELYVARLLGGLASGLAQGAATAALVELAPRERPRRAVVVTTAVTLGGFGVGGFIAGLVAAVVPSPLISAYVVYLVLLAVAGIGIARIPAGAMSRDSQPLLRLARITVPHPQKGTVVAAGIAAASAFTFLGLYASVVSSYLRRDLHEQSHLIAGALVFAVYAAAVAAQLVLGGQATSRVRIVGLAVLIIGLAALVVALDVRSLFAFVLATLAGGAGAGLTWMAGLATVSAVDPERSAGVFSAFFLVAYLGLAIPIVLVGAALLWVSSFAVIVGFSLVISALAMASFGWLWRREIVGSPLGPTF